MDIIYIVFPNSLLIVLDGFFWILTLGHFGFSTLFFPDIIIVLLFFISFYGSLFTYIAK